MFSKSFRSLLYIMPIFMIYSLYYLYVNRQPIIGGAGFAALISFMILMILYIFGLLFMYTFIPSNKIRYYVIISSIIFIYLYFVLCIVYNGPIY